MMIDSYLARIAYQGTVSPDLETLRRLQQAHMRAVPFENLNIHAGKPISLDKDDLYQKVVEKNRGGFCYELNSLFAHLLVEIGFKVHRVAANVATSDGGFGPDFDHMALVVALEGDGVNMTPGSHSTLLTERLTEGEMVLVDVGFGDSFQYPLKLAETGPQDGSGATYAIAHDDRGCCVLKQDAQKPGLPMEPQYRFTLTPQPVSAFAAMCVYHQTSPDSHFTRKLICSRATPEGRISLSNDRLIVRRGHDREETILSSQAAVAQALKTHFSIDL